mmetsp:Transcript_28763/g.84283  ORF Transcript_28763/g.84283 Transcript_28763/m.84283 type:complete len:223 (+) Transcript_28763:857-1525(+)
MGAGAGQRQASARAQKEGSLVASLRSALFSSTRRRTRSKAPDRTARARGVTEPLRPSRPLQSGCAPAARSSRAIARSPRAQARCSGVVARRSSQRQSACAGKAPVRLSIKSTRAPSPRATARCRGVGGASSAEPTSPAGGASAPASSRARAMASLASSAAVAWVRARCSRGVPRRLCVHSTSTRTRGAPSEASKARSAVSDTWLDWAVSADGSWLTARGSAS